jgi:hypothetical protein
MRESKNEDERVMRMKDLRQQEIEAAAREDWSKVRECYLEYTWLQGEPRKEHK